jgi:tetratricopeptide (TPR) repeat protein
MTRPTWIALLLLLLVSSSRSEEPMLTSPGLPDWEKGQKAMLDGQAEQAIASFRQSLKQDPALTRNYLSLAAAYLAEGEDEQAAEQLGQYLEARPDHLAVRGQYAELLWRLDRLEEAREQFERFDANIQDHETLAREHLVQCHTRLLDIAVRTQDEYGRHLHRGIALYWLARQRAEITDAGNELPSEGLFCQSASELVQARRERPDEARPYWYLYEVWSQLGQKQPARRWLRSAVETASLSYLTPAEQRQLHFARRREAGDGSRK